MVDGRYKHYCEFLCRTLSSSSQSIYIGNNVDLIARDAVVYKELVGTATIPAFINKVYICRTNNICPAAPTTVTATSFVLTQRNPFSHYNR